MRTMCVLLLVLGLVEPPIVMVDARRRVLSVPDNPNGDEPHSGQQDPQEPSTSGENGRRRRRRILQEEEEEEYHDERNHEAASVKQAEKIRTPIQAVQLPLNNLADTVIVSRRVKKKKKKGATMPVVPSYGKMYGCRPVTSGKMEGSGVPVPTSKMYGSCRPYGKMHGGRRGMM